MMINLSFPRGFRVLDLRPDGSIQAEFQISHFYLHTDWAILKTNLWNSDFYVFLNGSNCPIPVKFTDDDLQNCLPREAGYFVFPVKIKTDFAVNTNNALALSALARQDQSSNPDEVIYG